MVADVLMPLAFVAMTLASQASPAVNQSEEPKPPSGPADIELVAVVHADEVRFEVVPAETNIGPSRPGQIVEDHVERENIPEDPQPGVTYRNVTVKLTIHSSVAELESILAPLLGLEPQKQTTNPEREQKP